MGNNYESHDKIIMLDKVHRRAGYVKIKCLNHPLYKSYIPEHRLVMERYLRTFKPNSKYLIKIGVKKYLRPEIHVHHKNEIKFDNRVKNLQLMTLAEHTAHHNKNSRGKPWRSNKYIKIRQSKCKHVRTYYNAEIAEIVCKDCSKVLTKINL